MPTVYITAPRSEAPAIAESLVENRLAACVNRIPCESTYRWEGSVHHDEEAILIAKTSGERYAELVAHVQAIHPHEVPCIERFDERDVIDAYAEWVKSETID